MLSLPVLTKGTAATTASKRCDSRSTCCGEGPDMVLSAAKALCSAEKEEGEGGVEEEGGVELREKVKWR